MSHPIPDAALDDRQDDTDRCPKCNADFDGGPIPEEQREHYSPPYRWARRINLYDRSRDRTTAYKCPDCNHEWPR